MTNSYIAITGDKGGVGKTTIACLLAEYFIYKGKKVHLIDSDPNQNTKTWIDKCAEKGYLINSENPDITIVDCSGTSGSSLTKHIIYSDIIIAPFQPHISDLETILGWYLSLNSVLQEKVYFVPNRKLNTKEQEEGIKQVQSIIDRNGKGKLLPGLVNRPAVYPSFLNGDSKNFFSKKLDTKTKEELEALFSKFIPITTER